MERDLIGRDEELEAITRLLTRVSKGESAAVVIEGAVGIGKTALWTAALDAAAERGFLVLKAHPVEAETSYSFAALSDLLRPALAQVLQSLPPQQKVALEAALLIGEGDSPAPDPHAVSVAALTSLELLAEKRPVLVAVDDLQWLDSPSRTTLQFIARRLAPRVALVATERLEADDASAIELEGDRLRLGPLSAGALQQLVHERLGAALPRPTLLRVQEASGGHPFYALEIARALRTSDASYAATEPLPVPGSLRQLVARRLGAISSDTRSALLSVAASARPEPDLVSPEALREAMAADVVVVEGGRVRFTHPLFGSVLYADAPASERRAVHHRLAELVLDEEEAARHLAFAATRPDEEVALRLERAAARARARGATTAAAELIERASELTPETNSTERLRRALDAAEFHLAGRTPGASRILDAVLPKTSGDLRARALLLMAVRRGLVEYGAPSPLLEEALEHVKDPALELQIRLELVNLILRGATPRSARHADRAVELAEQGGDDGLLAVAIASRAALHEDPLAELERAADLERRSGANVHARLQLALLQLSRGSDAGRLSLNALLEQSLAAGIRAHNWVIGTLAHAETRAGNFQRGKQLASEFRGYTVAEQNRLGESAALTSRAYAEACLGELDEARHDAETAIRLADEGGYEGRSIQGRALLGFIALSAGETERSVRPFEEAAARALAVDPGRLPPFAISRLAIPIALADAVEAFCEMGRVDETRPLIAWLEREHRNPWHQGLAGHCRGLVAAARRDHDPAVAELADAARRLEPLSLPLDHGRALLALGSAQRRAGEKAEARPALLGALETFERIGAPLWGAKAENELARIGGRPRAEHGLTPSEVRVAQLVAAGRTNKEVAAALFISAKTVEGHLANVYEKLGVRSRAELARKMASEGSAGP